MAPAQRGCIQYRGGVSSDLGERLKTTTSIISAAWPLTSDDAG